MRPALEKKAEPAKFNRRCSWVSPRHPGNQLLPVCGVLQGRPPCPDRRGDQSKNDKLMMGLKENVIISKLIPAGTGMKQLQKDISLDYRRQ